MVVKSSGGCRLKYTKLPLLTGSLWVNPPSFYCWKKSCSQLGQVVHCTTINWIRLNTLIALKNGTAYANDIYVVLASFSRNCSGNCQTTKGMYGKWQTHIHDVYCTNRAHTLNTNWILTIYYYASKQITQYGYCVYYYFDRNRKFGLWACSFHICFKFAVNRVWLHPQQLHCHMCVCCI